MKRLLVGLLFALAPATADAVEGRYRGETHGMHFDVQVERVVDTTYRVDIDVTRRPGCGGSVVALVNITRSTALFRASHPERDAFGPRVCDVLMRFDGRRLHLEEGEGCVRYRGAACSFTGDLTRR